MGMLIMGLIIGYLLGGATGVLLIILCMIAGSDRRDDE